MSLLLWGITFGVVGKIIIGVAILRVHIRILEEHRIDNVVLTAIKREHWITVVGLLLIVVGYILEISFYSGSTGFFENAKKESAAVIQSLFV